MMPLELRDAGPVVHLTAHDVYAFVRYEQVTKFFVRGLTEALNIEWERHGIHVCDVMPNFVDTPMMAAADGDIVGSIGINLTAADVADTILRAADDRSRVHWKVDTRKNHVFIGLLNRAPRRLHRAAMKRLAGF